MKLKAWKKIKQSVPFRKAKMKMKQLSGKEPLIKVNIKLDIENYSNWELAPALLKEGDIIYSFGICDDIGFELDVLKKNVNIFAFDPTPYSVDWIKKQKLPANFHFYPWAASATDGSFYLYPRLEKKGKKSTIMYTLQKEAGEVDGGVKIEAFSLQSVADKLNHSEINVLKMDIEGAEYGIIDNLIESNFRPRMLLVEFHHRFKGIGINKTTKAVKDLRGAGYLIASVSLKNREVCFVHKTAVA